MIKVNDLNGYTIEVTDLKEAIQMAREFKDNRHEDKHFSDFDKRQNTYWTDMYQKLTAVKKRLDDN